MLGLYTPNVSAHIHDTYKELSTSKFTTHQNTSLTHQNALSTHIKIKTTKYNMIILYIVFKSDKISGTKFPMAIAKSYIVIHAESIQSHTHTTY